MSSFRNKKWLPVAAIVGLAIGLPASLLEYRFADYKRYPGVPDVADAPDGLVIPFRFQVIVPTGRIALSPLLGNASPLYREGIVGLYVRRGVPAPVGYIGGILAPIMLLGTCIYIVVRSR